MSTTQHWKVLVLCAAGFLNAPDRYVMGLPKAAEGCWKDPAYSGLDFWVGNWDVFDSDGSKTGTNKIKKIMHGCVITEDWRGVDDAEFKGFVYFEPVRKNWKYVLIGPGGSVKERVQVDDFSNKGVRFEGQVKNASGGNSHLDRMTLIPLPNNRIRETVETSSDGGKTWKATFDGEYRRRPTKK